MTNWRDASFGLRFLVICGIAAAIMRTGPLLVVGAMTPGYSHLVNFNSELSARDAAYHDVMTLVLYLVGTLLFLFAIGLARWTRPSSIGRWGSIVLAVTGVAFVFIGVFPCDPGCSLQDPSPTMKAHLLAGFGGMTLQAIAIAIFAFYGRKTGEDPRIGNVSKILGSIVVLAMAWLYAAYFGLAHLLPNPVIAQKIFTVAADLWLACCAILMMRTQVDQPE